MYLDNYSSIMNLIIVHVDRALLMPSVAVHRDVLTVVFQDG